MKGIRKNITLSQLLFFVTALLAGNAVFANVKLPAIFNDGMVLQQKEKVIVWGWADPGERVTLEGSWSTKKIAIIADNKGNWKTVIETTKAGGPYTLTIKGNNTIELKDVLLGEVWLCSGQSNMVFSLKGDQDVKEEIAMADLPSIRYFSVNRQYGLQSFNDAPGSAWVKTSPATAGSFSAVAFYFAKKIQAQLKVPIGIVYAAWGGTPAEAWTPAEVMTNDSSLAVYFDRWKTIQESAGKDSTAYHLAVAEWKKDSTASKKPEEPQTFYYYKRPWREPSVLFNGMIKPVIPYAIKGVLWYQGESNVGYADEYYRLFGSMINGWRKEWDRKDLPFYFVQLPPYGYKDLDAAATVRDAQYQVMRSIPNTGMAVTMDVGNMKDIHPTKKKPVGERLARIALARDYSVKGLSYKGPECRNVTTRHGELIIEFSSALAAGAAELKGFEIGYTLPGTDSIVFTKVLAKIQGNRVIISNGGVVKPLEVRYAWLSAGEANLFDTEGLPAFPFRRKLMNK